MSIRRSLLRRSVVASLVVVVAANGCGADVIAPSSNAIDTGAEVPTALATTPPIAVGPIATPTALVVGTPPTSAPTATPATSGPVPTSPAASEAELPTATVTPVPVPPPPAQSVTPQREAPSAQAVLAANGAEVYTLNCARCHGENGLGSFQYSGISGVSARYTTDSMIGELTTGHPVTFGFAGKLSEEEIASVVAYVLATF